MKAATAFPTTLSARRDDTVQSAVLADSLLTRLDSSTRQERKIHSQRIYHNIEYQLSEVVAWPSTPAARTGIISSITIPIQNQSDFFDMSNVTMPTYIIGRDTQPGQPIDPTAELVFYPPKGSDELFDALRTKYPHLKTHSERMGEAVMQFYLEEQQVQIPTPTPPTSTLTSPWQASMQSMSSGSSIWSSPELFDLATPSFRSSPQPQTQPFSRQESVATTATVPSNPTPPAIELMTGVFSLSNAAQPKERKRRKMTAAEKIEYRKRRIVKACEKCSKRKRKCHHNQPEMETVGTPQAQKVAKPSLSPATKKPPPMVDPRILSENATFGANTIDFGDLFGSDMSMPGLGEYSSVFEDSLPDMSLDDILMPQQQWPWSDTPDWTLMDSSTEGLYDESTNFTCDDLDIRGPQVNAAIPGHGDHHNFHNRGGGWMTPLLQTVHSGDLEMVDQLLTGGADVNVGDQKMFDHDIMQSTGGGADQQKMQWSNSRTGQEDGQTRKQQPMHTPHVHDAESKQAFVSDGTYQALSYDWGDQQLVSRAPNNSYPPQLSSHVPGHGQLSQDYQDIGDGEGVKYDWPQNSMQAEQGSGTQHNSLSQMTLRLTGTAKAVKAFGNLLPSSSPRRSRLQSVSLKKVALLALGGFSMAQDLQKPHSVSLRHTTSPFYFCSGCSTRFNLPKELRRHMISHHPRKDLQASSGVKGWICSDGGRLEPDMTTEDYLRMLTNVSPVQEDGREAVSRAPDILATPRNPGATSITSVSAGALADVERSVKSKIQSYNPDSESSEAKIHTHRSSAAQEGRHVPSLGEGLTTSASPTTELYLLKRRIPQALHTVVDRNSPSAALGPLLTTIPENVDTYSQRDYEREMVISRNTECTEGNSILADGGAYLTSDTTDDNARLTGSVGLARVARQPVHIRPRNPTATDFAGDTDQHQGAGSFGLGHNASIAVNAARVPAPTVKFDISAFDTPSTVNQVDAYRLCDHVRRRDHFGRPSRSIPTAGEFFALAATAVSSLFAIATLLLLLIAVRTSPTTLSLLLLALASPVSGTKGSERFLSRDWTPPRDIIENSSWHTGLRYVQNHLPARKYMQRLLYRGCESEELGRGRRGTEESVGSCVVV